MRDTNAFGARGVMASGNGDLSFYPNSFIDIATAALTIRNQSGNVGIGTVTPISKLHVVTAGAGAQAVVGWSPGGNGVVGTSSASGLAAVAGVNYVASGVGTYGEANAGLLSNGVWGKSNEGIGVYGLCNSAQGEDSAGMLGRNTANNGTGVIGEANVGLAAWGVLGRSNQGAGVYGYGRVGCGCTAANPEDQDSFALLAQGYTYLIGSLTKGPDPRIFASTIPKTRKTNTCSIIAPKARTR